MSRASTTFADMKLARRLERAEALSCAGIVAGRAEVEGDGAVFEHGGAHALFDGAESPMTQCFGLGVHEAADDGVIDAIERFYGERAAPTHFEVCPLTGVELTDRLVRRGYRPIEMSNVLHRPLDEEAPIDGKRDPALVSRVCADDEADLWAEAAAGGWKEHGDFFELFRSVARINAKRPDSHAFLVELDGRPVAAGGLIINEGVAHLAGASTVPEYRRRGAQLALLDHRLRFAVEHGCDLAMMGAEPGSASQRNAERHGFHIAYTRTKWRREVAAG